MHGHSTQILSPVTEASTWGTTAGNGTAEGCVQASNVAEAKELNKRQNHEQWRPDEWQRGIEGSRAKAKIRAFPATPTPSVAAEIGSPTGSKEPRGGSLLVDGRSSRERLRGGFTLGLPSTRANPTVAGGTGRADVEKKGRQFGPVFQSYWAGP